MDLTWRHTAAVIAVCAAALFAILDVIPRPAADPFGAAVQIDRLELIREKIPDSGMLEFVSDVPPSAALNSMLFFTAQYALAPRLLVDSGKAPNAQWAIGYFAHPEAIAGFAQTRGWAIALDLQGGVVLFNKGAVQQ